jgi:hypothetical protein
MQYDTYVYYESATTATAASSEMIVVKFVLPFGTLRI